MAGTRESILKNREFLKLWAGESVSMFGSEITLLALPLAAVLTLHASVAQLGVLNAAKFAPFLLLALPVGAWIDRVRRRPILIAANVGSAIVLGSVPVMAAFGVLTVDSLVLTAFLSGVFAVFLHVGFWSYVPSVIADADLADANSKMYASASAAAAGGPGLGGVLVQVLTAPGALLIDAGSFVVGAASLASIRSVEPPVDRQDIRSVRADIREGLHFVFGNPYLRAFASEAAMFNLFFSVMMTALLVYAVRVLHMTAVVLGIVIACGAVGSLIGSLAASRVARRVVLGRAIVWSMLLGTWPFLLVALVSKPGFSSLLILATAFLTSGVAIGVVVVLVVTLRQIVTPNQMMGRMNASYRCVVWGSNAIGAILGGVLGSTLGLSGTILVGTVGIALSPIFIIASPIRQLRTADEAVSRHAWTDRQVVYI